MDRVGSRRPGRPRSAEVERAIIDATLDRLVADGIGGLSIEGVAADAGVGKATIYRRWPNKQALVIGALTSVQVDPPALAGDSVRDDLIALVDTIRARSEGARAVALMRCMLAEADRHPDVASQFRREVVEPRRERIREVLRRGVATGELRADLDVELAMTLVTAPMLAVTTFRPESGRAHVSKDFAARLVDTVLAGIAADPAAGHDRESKLDSSAKESSRSRG